MHKFPAFFLSVLLSLLEVTSLFAFPSVFARAQTTAYAEIVAVDAQNFPKVSALLDVFTANGEFMSGLEPEDLTLYEDGQPRAVDTLTEAAAPVQLVVAINPGPGLAVRDANGVPRFTQVVGALSQWVDSQPSDSRDDLSLVSLSGSLITHAARETGSSAWIHSSPIFGIQRPTCKRFPSRWTRSARRCRSRA